ncbi:Putative prophage phiRv2 integrase [Mycobacterium simulans]|nr:Putative prophage phiRv2 integrase [Mycobacterium simulans]
MSGTTPWFDEFAGAWLAERTVSGRTRDSYRRLLRARLLPTFAVVELRDISSAGVNEWYASSAAGPATVRRHAYSLLRSIMDAVLARGLIDATPCQITGVTTSHRAEKTHPATHDEIETIAAGMRESYQALVLMAAWLAMPISELRELRRKDVDLVANVVRVRRAVALVDGVFKLTTPKSKEGIRDISIPPHLLRTITTHLQKHVQIGRESLLLAMST